MENENRFFITQNLIFSGMFINRRRLWAPKARHIPPVTLSFLFLFSFLLHFSFFLSSSLSVLLQSKNLILIDHSHAQRFFLLSSDFGVLSFLFFSLRSLTRRPMPTQAERSSASIFDHTLKSSTTRSFSSSLLSYLFFNLPGASRSAFTATIRSESFVVGAQNNFVGSFFFLIFNFIFISCCIINKNEWIFEFGVMRCFWWC